MRGNRRDTQDLKKTHRNNVIWEKKNIKNYVLEYVRYKQAIWYDDLRRMNEEKLPWRFLEWCLLGRRRRKWRTRNSWIQGVTTGMREKGINSMECIEKEGWRRKIKLQLATQKDVKILILCT